MIFNNIKLHLNSLCKLLLKLNDKQYCEKIIYLSHSSIGAHTRHIIEILNCLLNGYEINNIDYINRKRDLELEINKHKAIKLINEIIDNLEKPDKKITIREELNKDSNYYVETTYYREIVYNQEHIVHHFASIKVALIEMNILHTDNNFGFAYSTIKYNESMNNS